MTEQANLLPCPFCGGEPYFGGIDDEDHPDFDGRYIGCKNCGCATRLAFAAMDDPYPALIDAWNTRAPDRDLIRYALVQSGWGKATDVLKEFEAYWSERGWNIDRIDNPSGYIEFKDKGTHDVWMGWRAGIASIPQPPFTDLDAAVETIASGWEASE